MTDDILKSHGAAIALVNELLDALERSVKLQSHYARLLNMHDGGQRLSFDDCDQWLERLRSLKGTEQ